MSHFYKHLPCNEADSDDDDDGDADPYSSDHFRMYEFKVRRCTRSRSHDWTDCPFAHPGEKARRRDPRKFHYTGTVCPEFRRGGGCARGDNCEFAHGVFECWLHPSRYRTEACKDGKGCKRKVCFFAHTPRQLRLLPEKPSPASAAAAAARKDIHHCGGCLACRGGGSSSSVASSPTSTLLGMSHLSPPLSPSMSSSSPPMSPAGIHHRGGGSGGFAHRLSKSQSRLVSYKDVLTELMSSLEAMNFSEEAAAAAVAAAVSSPPSVSYDGGSGGGRKMNLSVNPWVNEVCFNSIGDENYHHQLDQQQQQQFVMSPSTPNYANSGFDKYLIGAGGEYFPAKINGPADSEFVAGAERTIGSNGNEVENGGGCDPDLGWVNELLM
ncbi:unnamed protein product [Linum tenue]|uniref:C3H1-type domain-containing protein n=1 Tax=Linum tenue TaxID=586396 RepID=A0AAV0HKQ4_9ROSI|nr:unnamed protein product [Linum tenue]